MSQAATTSIQESSPNPSQRNAAVQRCCAASDYSFQESRVKNLESYLAKKYASQAFCAAMPNLDGYENIRDFIACAAHGMLIGVIDHSDGAKFLSAAQVALGALRHEPKDKKCTAA